MSNLMEHAKRELDRAGVDKDIYGDMTSKAVLELVDTFSKQGHSGHSAALVLSLFSKVANFENLTPLTDHPDEWNQVGPDLWQNTRRSEAFSEDNGRTYRLLSEDYWEGEGEDRHRVRAAAHESERVDV